MKHPENSTYTNSKEYKNIINILGKERLWKQDIEQMQNALAKLGYSNNSSAFGADGHLGAETLQDLIDFLQQNPDTIAEISPTYKKHLAELGQTTGQIGQLSSILQIRRQDQREGLAIGAKESIRSQIEEVLDNGKRTLNDLTTDEIKSLQTNWMLLGEYPSNYEIDGKAGPATQKAYNNHRASIDVVKTYLAQEFENNTKQQEAEAQLHERFTQTQDHHPEAETNPADMKQEAKGAPFTPNNQ